TESGAASFELLAKRSVNQRILPVPPIRLDDRPWPVGGQLEGRNPPPESLEPKCLGRRELFTQLTADLPSSKVIELFWPWKTRPLASADGRIEQSEFTHYHTKREAVGNDVVGAKHQPMMLLLQLDEIDPEQWSSGQVEWFINLTFKPRFHICF